MATYVGARDGERADQELAPAGLGVRGESRWPPVTRPSEPQSTASTHWPGSPPISPSHRP